MLRFRKLWRPESDLFIIILAFTPKTFTGQNRRYKVIMPVETRASAARRQSAIDSGKPRKDVDGTQAGGIDPPRKKRKRVLEPEDSAPPAETSDPVVASDPAVEEIIQRLGDLRLDRQLEIAESDTDIIKRIAEGEYKFTLPIKSLDFFHRSAWGVKDSATEIVVNLMLLKHETGTHYGFCVHLEPADLADKYHHNLTTTDGPWRDMTVCNKASNFLTDALGRDLHAFLRQPGVDKDGILGRVLSEIKKVVSSDPTKSCVICGSKLRTAAWRPSPCSKEECRRSLKKWSLETRLSPFLRCPEVLDFLLACLYTGARPVASSNAWNPSMDWPPGFNWAELRKAMDTFPSINNETSISTLMSSSGGHKAAKEQLLSWLCTDFESTLVPAPPSTRVSFQDCEQFLILNGPRNREEQVANELKKQRKTAVGGQGAFHGTPEHNLFSILHLGLKNSAGSVWYSSQAAYSLGFNMKMGAPGVLAGPRNSKFKNKTVLFGVEAAHPNGPLTDANAINMASETRVALRYAYVLPKEILHGKIQVPQGSKLRRVMEQTFAKIRSGKVLQELGMEAKEVPRS